MSEYRSITIPQDYLSIFGPLTPGSSLWHEDIDYPNCELCNNKFTTLLNRRHHCRNCGKIICDDCLLYHYTSKTQEVPHVVCKLCKYCIFQQEGKESTYCQDFMQDAKLLDDSLDDSDPEGGGYKHSKNKSKRKNKRSVRRRMSKRSNMRRKNKNKKVTKRMRKSRRR